MEHRVRTKRAPRANAEQVEALVSYMQEHARFATGKFCGKEGRRQQEDQWVALAQSLNEIRGGARKDAKQWATVWRDLRYRTGEKVSALRRERVRTGNWPIETPPLTALEIKIQSIVGDEYFSGTSAEDSIPEEESAQVVLEKGDYEITPQPIEHVTVPVVFCSDAVEEMEVACASTQFMEDIDSMVFSVNSDHTQIVMEPSNQSEEIIHTPNRAGIPAEGKTAECRSRAANANTRTPARSTCTETIAGRGRRNRMGQQLMEARREFAELQKTATENMQTLAEATKQIAAAAKLQAEADMRRVKNEERQQENIEAFLNLLKPLVAAAVARLNK